MSILNPEIPAQRRIGGSYATLSYVGGTVMIAELSGALTALRTTLDIAKIAVETRDANKLAEARIAMNERLIDVTNAALALQEKQAALINEKQALEAEIGKLTRQIGEFEKWDSELANYERTQTKFGAVTYVDKSTRDSDGPAVYLCANCIAERKKTFLQPAGRHLVCHVHGTIWYR